jgi:hypothetical protein
VSKNEDADIAIEHQAGQRGKQRQWHLSRACLINEFLGVLRFGNLELSATIFPVLIFIVIVKAGILKTRINIVVAGKTSCIF